MDINARTAPSGQPNSLLSVGHKRFKVRSMIRNRHSSRPACPRTTHLTWTNQRNNITFQSPDLVLVSTPKMVRCPLTITACNPTGVRTVAMIGLASVPWVFLWLCSVLIFPVDIHSENTSLISKVGIGNRLFIPSTTNSV